MKHYGKLEKNNTSNKTQTKQQEPPPQTQTAFRVSTQIVIIERLQIHIIETHSTNSDRGRV